MPPRDTHRDTSRGRSRSLEIRRAVGFAIAFVLAVLLALDNGGYDEALRHKVGIALWALVAFGFAAGLLPRSRLSTPAWVALGGFAALAAYTLLSASWSESDERTYAEVARVLQYGAIVVLAYTALNRHTWQGAAAGFAAAALLVPFVSIVSRLAPDLMTDEAAEALMSDRLSHPFGYWNAVGAWGAMATAIGLCWSGHAARRAVRAFALAAVPVAVASTYLTYSRGGVAAMAIAVIAAVALSRSRWTVAANAAAAAAGSALVVLTIRGQDEIANATGSAGAGSVVLTLLAAGALCAGVAFLSGRLDELQMTRGPGRMAAGGAVLVALLTAAVLHGPIERAWDEFTNEQTIAPSDDPAARLGSVGGTRYTVWTEALDAFDLDRGRGLGAGTFEFHWSQNADTSEFIRDAHSLYLETLAELGLPGLICLLIALGGLAVAAWPARNLEERDAEHGARAAMGAAFTVFLFSAGIDWMWEMAAVGALALGGIAVAGAGNLSRWGRRRPSAPAGFALAAVALALAAVQVPGLVADDRVGASDRALADGDLPAAQAAADEAVRAEPWAASPYLARALVAQADGRLDDARSDLEEAIEREPTNFRHRLVLATVEARSGNRAAALESLRAARELAPRSLLLAPTAPAVVEITESRPRPSSTGP